MLLIPTLILLVLVFLWWQLPLKNWLLVSIAVLFVVMVSDITSTLFALLLIIAFGGFTALLYFLPGIRKQYVSTRLYEVVREKTGSAAKIRQEAVDAETACWDTQLFCGKPDWDVLFEIPVSALSSEEQAFMDGPVEELCAMVDDWEITHQLNDLPQPVWEFLRQNRFFGLNISPEYGGPGFSAHARSCIVQKLSSRSGTVAATVMVPNSLGPAELLAHYGTSQQKKLYLPKLAAGEEIPCFGLTSLRPGCAVDGPDCGIVCEGRYKRKKVLGFRVNWTGRHIALGPVATLLGLTFRACDPDHLLGDQAEPGITCALVPVGTKGVSIGNRHRLSDTAFQSGPVSAKNIFIPMDWVIGGEACVGQGERMLMHCLAVGSGMSGSAAGVGAARLAATTSGAYCRVGEQFDGHFDGWARSDGGGEMLAHIGGLAWLVDAGQTLSASASVPGHGSALISAVTGQQCSDLSRMAINHAMELHGGKAMCMGPGNYLARIYQQIPIGIAAEGANRPLRSLAVSGAGLIRRHPYRSRQVAAVTMQDRVDGLDQFDAEMVRHIEHISANKLRAFGYGLTRGRVAKGFGKGLVKKHSRAIEHLSAGLAYLADVAWFLPETDPETEDRLAERFADVLGNLYLASAVLKTFTDNGEPEKEEALLDWACRFALFRAQQTLVAITADYPYKIPGVILRITIFPGGRYLHLADDELSREVARSLQKPGSVRDRLARYVFMAKDSADAIAQLETTFRLMVRTADLRKRLKKSEYRATPLEDYPHWLERLRSDEVISAEESELLAETMKMAGRVMQPDDFASAEPPGK